MQKLISLALVGAILITKTNAWMCDEAMPFDQFNATQFSGDWFPLQVGSIPGAPYDTDPYMSTGIDATCQRVSYDIWMNGTGNAKYWSYDLDLTTASVMEVPFGNNMGAFIQNVDAANSGWIYRSEVVAWTDYKNFAIVYGCDSTEGQYPSVSLLSRDWNVSMEAFANFTKYAGAKKLPKKSNSTETPLLPSLPEFPSIDAMAQAWTRPVTQGGNCDYTAIPA